MTEDWVKRQCSKDGYGEEANWEFGRVCLTAGEEDLIYALVEKLTCQDGHAQIRSTEAQGI